MESKWLRRRQRADGCTPKRRKAVRMSFGYLKFLSRIPLTLLEGIEMLVGFSGPGRFRIQFEIPAPLADGFLGQKHAFENQRAIEENRRIFGMLKCLRGEDIESGGVIFRSILGFGADGVGNGEFECQSCILWILGLGS